MRKIVFIFLLVLVFTIPWENAITIIELGTLTRVIGFLTAGLWIASSLINGKIRKPSIFQGLVLIFILWNILSIFWTIGLDETVVRIKTYLQLGILSWMLWDMVTTISDVGAVLQAYILGAYVAIGSTIVNYVQGQQISTYDYGRFTGADINAVDLALILILGIPAAWYLATSAGRGIRGSIQRVGNMIYIPLAFFTVILTASRMAVFASIPPVLYILWSIRRLKPAWRLVFPLLLVGILAGIYPLIPQDTLARLATTGSSIAAGDLGGRVILWDQSLSIYAQHTLLGIGAGSLDLPTELGTVAHNTYISILTELGLVGFIFFIFLLGWVVLQAFHKPRRFQGLWLTILAIWAIGVFTLTWENRKPTWLFLSMVVISANIPSYASQRRVPSNTQFTYERSQENFNEIPNSFNTGYRHP